MTVTDKQPELRIARGFALPLDLVTEATAIVATRGAGKSSASAVIVEEAFAARVQCVVFDRTGVYWGLRSSAAGDQPGLPIYVLGGPHGDAPLEPHAGVLIADLVVDSGHSFVLDLSDFSKSAAVRFAADFLERLYDRKANARTSLLLVMDEAHFYAPQTPRGGFKGESAKLMGAMEDVVGLGRSRGLGVVLTTQRTQALNKAVLDLIETLLVMRMLSPRARQAVKDWIQEKHEDDERGVIPSLDSLPTGTAWVWSPLRGVLEKVTLRRIRTFDSYATPTPGQARVEPTARRELDLDALGEQIRATAERAKENDPGELRRRLAVTEAELQKSRESGADLHRLLEQERAREPEPVAVYTIGDLDALWKLVQAAVAAGEALTAELGEVARPLAEAILQAKEAAERAPRADRTARERPGPSRPVEPRDRGSVGTSAAASPALALVQPPDAVRPAGVVGPAQQKILDALAWWRVLRVYEPTLGQVAFVVGNHPRSKGFTNNLGSLSTAGLIQRGPGVVALTGEGLAVAGAPRDRPTEAEYQEMIYAQVGGKRADILRYLIARHDDDVPVDELAEHMGYHPRSKGFTNNLGSLSGLGLVARSPGRVRASDLCFLV